MALWDGLEKITANEKCPPNYLREPVGNGAFMLHYCKFYAISIWIALGARHYCNVFELHFTL